MGGDEETINTLMGAMIYFLGKSFAILQKKFIIS
jgi:hypothetical protein